MFSLFKKKTKNIPQNASENIPNMSKLSLNNSDKVTPMMSKLLSPEEISEIKSNPLNIIFISLDCINSVKVGSKTVFIINIDDINKYKLYYEKLYYNYTEDTGNILLNTAYLYTMYCKAVKDIEYKNTQFNKFIINSLMARYNMNKKIIDIIKVYINKEILDLFKLAKNLNEQKMLKQQKRLSLTKTIIDNFDELFLTGVGKIYNFFVSVKGKMSAGKRAYKVIGKRKSHKRRKTNRKP